MAAPSNIGVVKEGEAKTKLTKLFEANNIVFHKFPDTYAARGVRIPPQPSDFVILYGDQGAFLEFKYMSDDEMVVWRNSKLRPYQREIIEKCRKFGTQYYVLIQDDLMKCYYFIPGNFLIDFEIENKNGSINRRFFEPYKIAELNEIINILINK